MLRLVKVYNAAAAMNVAPAVASDPNTPTPPHPHGRSTCPCSVAEVFYEKLRQRAQSIQIGDPLTPGCRMGPVVSASQYDRVRHYVQVQGGGVDGGVAGASLVANLGSDC
jgi:hypothetical protein